MRDSTENTWQSWLLEIASTPGVVDQHGRLLERRLEILSEEGFLQRIGDGWKVLARPTLSSRHCLSWIGMID